MAAKRQGLRLTLPGAPNTPHTFPGIPGFYRPDLPTPVGKEGEVDLELARSLDKDKGVHLKLVEIPASEVKEAEELASEQLVASKEGLDAERGLPSEGRAGQAASERIESEEK